MTVGSATVRAAIQNWFAPPAIPGLNKVWAAEPWYLDPQDFDLVTSGGWGAVGFVHLDGEQESRTSLPAGGGIKTITYRVSLVLIYQYFIPQDLGDPSHDESQWVGPLDDLVDAVKARIRADQTFGTGAAGPIWQAGEDRDDIRVERDLPQTDAPGGKLWCWQRVEFDVVEQISA